MRWLAVLVSVICAGVLLTGCGRTSASLATCGRVPTSTGPERNALVVRLIAPSHARSGSQVTVDFILRARRGVVHDSNFGVSSANPVEIAEGGRIVGYYAGAIAGTGIGGPWTTVGRRYADGGALLGCPHGPINLTYPDASRRPLTPGRYQLVVVVPYNTNYHDGHPGESYSLVATAPITVTAAG